jgi:hypothetical protein
MNTFLPMLAIGNAMEVPCIRISFKDELAFRPLVSDIQWK